MTQKTLTGAITAVIQSESNFVVQVRSDRNFNCDFHFDPSKCSPSTGPELNIKVNLKMHNGSNQPFGCSNSGGELHKILGSGIDQFEVSCTTRASQSAPTLIAVAPKDYSPDDPEGSVTLNFEVFGPDGVASLTISERP